MVRFASAPLPPEPIGAASDEFPPAPPVALADTWTVPVAELPNALVVGVPPEAAVPRTISEYPKSPPFPPVAVAETDTELFPVAIPVLVAAASPPAPPCPGGIVPKTPLLPPLPRLHRSQY